MVDHMPWQAIPAVWALCGLALLIARRRATIRNRKHT